MKYILIFITTISVACTSKQQAIPLSNNSGKQEISKAPTVSPTAKIYFLQNYPGDIFSVNPDGSHHVNLTNDGMNGNFDISADGNKILFGNLAGDNWNIYTADITASGLANKKKVYNGKYRDEDCRFSPDASKIVFKTNRYGINEQNNSGVYDIVILNIATGKLTRLTHDTAQEAWAPCFSSDGLKVAFVLRTNSKGASSDEIYMVNTDGTELKRITKNNYDDWYPGFSANGNLLYISKKVASCDDDIYQIPAAALATANPESQSTVLNINACDFVSDADPYGSKTNENNMVFVSTRGGTYGVYIADKSTGAVSLVLQKPRADLLGAVLHE